MMQPAIAKDSIATLAAAGVIAYVFETLGHEAAGHGSMCMALGGRIEAIAPLWMRCSMASPFITAAGPLFNILAALLLGALLYQKTRLSTASYLLFLACAFNGLVACGYLMVGGAAGFGDWAVLFGAIKPPWIWRSLSVAVGLAAYRFSLQQLSHLYHRVSSGGSVGSILRRRVLVPGLSAGLVACAAELSAGQRNPFGFVLPLACTIVPALSLLSIKVAQGRPVRPDQAVVLPFSTALVALALVAGAFFIGVVGLDAGLVS